MLVDALPPYVPKAVLRRREVGRLAHVVVVNNNLGASPYVSDWLTTNDSDLGNDIGLSLGVGCRSMKNLHGVRKHARALIYLRTFRGGDAWGRGETS